jgi:hypothetical protein
MDAPYIPFTFEIAMGVRKDDEALAATLDDVIDSHGPAIRTLLERYGVPLVEPSPALARITEEQP